MWILLDWRTSDLDDSKNMHHPLYVRTTLESHVRHQKRALPSCVQIWHPECVALSHRSTRQRVSGEQIFFGLSYGCRLGTELAMTSARLICVRL